MPFQYGPARRTPPRTPAVLTIQVAGVSPRTPRAAREDAPASAEAAASSAMTGHRSLQPLTTLGLSATLAPSKGKGATPLINLHQWPTCTAPKRGSS